MSTIYYKELEQGSFEWLQFRIGKITKRHLKNIIDKRNGKLKSKDVIITQLSKVIAEISTGFSSENDYISDDMQWGIDNEMDAMQPYIKEQSFRPGFAMCDRFKRTGLSPDYIITDTIGIEAKCPNSNTHVSYIIKNVLPSDYLIDVMTYFCVIEELQEMIFVSYDPRQMKFPERFEKIVKRDEYTGFIKTMSESILEFEQYVDIYMKKYGLKTK